MTTRRTLLIASALGAASASSVFAHSDEAHADKAAPAKKEQKPWGIAGDDKAVKRTVTFTMTDNMRFTPDKLAVKQGETVKLVIKNKGKVMHEFVLGTKKELDEHAALMVKFPTMEHDEPYMAHVGPGKTGQIVWHFNKAGSFDFACLMAGHYAAGMVGKITVLADSELGSTSSPDKVVTVWKTPNCGCCKDWVSHLRDAGFQVVTNDVGDTAPVRQKLGLPAKFGSCHTAQVGGYVLEGHVPAQEVKRLLREKPAAIGLAVPDMPVGSPGMEMQDDMLGVRDAFDVVLVNADGSSRIFQSYPAKAATKSRIKS